MPSLERTLARYRRGETIELGPQVSLHPGMLIVRGEDYPLNTLRPLILGDVGAVEIRRIGAKDPPLVLEPGEVEDPLLLVDLANALISEIPYIKRRSISGWPPGSVGDLSSRIGYDWRELVIYGYSDEQIRGVLNGDCTVHELLSRRPEGRRR